MQIGLHSALEAQPFPMSRAQFLRSLRSHRRLSQQELAQQAGLNASTLSALEQQRNDDRAVQRANAIAMLRVLYQVESLTPDEIERFRDEFSLAARDVAEAVGDLQRAANATADTAWAEQIRTSVARIAAHIGAEATAEHLANLAGIISLASAQTDYDGQVSLAAKLRQLRARSSLPGGTSSGQSLSPAHHSPEPDEAHEMPAGSNVEQIEQFTIDEATDELRRLVALRDRGVEVSPSDFARAIAYIARKTASTE